MKRYELIETYEAKKAFNEHYGVEAVWPDTFTNYTQIGSKQAWVLRDRNGNLYLQSYGTLVSIKWADNHEFTRLGKWSVTTSRHQSEFERRF